MTGLLIGSHVERNRPLAGAAARRADVVQINLSAPQTWRAPQLRGDERDIAASSVPLFVHAPYLINAASINPVIRDKSRRCIIEQLAAASLVNARGLVVHGGHPTGSGTVEDGIRGWLEVLEGVESPCRVLIENTAGGSAAVARHIDAIERLFDRLRGAGHDVGFVLDTCHAHAGGMGMLNLVERVKAAVGVIDLVHLNDSKDAADSGRDRHEHLGAGQIDPSLLVEVVIASGAPVVVETPGEAEDQAADIEWMRSKVAAV